MNTENRLYAALLAMVVQHCAVRGPLSDCEELDSYAISANTDAMTVLAEAGFVVIEREAAGRIFGTITAEGAALLAESRVA